MAAVDVRSLLFPDPETAQLKEDYDTLSNSEKLAEGLLLVDSSSPDRRGRVIFTLQEIPAGIVFETPSNNWVKKQDQKHLLLGSPGASKTASITVDAEVTSNNKDTFFFSALQNDLCLLNDKALLEKVGITLQEQISGTPKTIRSLEDLPVDVKYFTENGNIVHRCSESIVRIGDTSTSIGPVTDTDTSDSSKAAAEARSILLGGSEDTPEGETASAAELCPVVASLLTASPDFPRVTSLLVEGSATHTAPLVCKCVYQGGVEGSSTLRWEKAADGNVFRRIPGANETSYQPNVDDVGSNIRVAYTPVRADGVSGVITFSKPVTIAIDPAMKEEVDANTALGLLLVKALLVNGEEFQKRTIVLNRTKVKVKKRRSTLSKVRHGDGLRVVASRTNCCQFTLYFADDDYYEFITPSAQQRDLTVLTILEYNRIYSCGPALDNIDPAAIMAARR